MSRNNTDFNGKARAKSQLRKVGLGMAGLLIVSIVLYLFAAPLFQPLVYAIVMDSPILVFYWFIPIAFALAVAIGGTYAGYENASTYAKYGLVAIFVFSILVVTPLSVVAEKQHYADRTADKMETQSLVVDDESTLPALDADNHRNVPLTKAHQDASNNFQKSQHKLSRDADITYVNGEPYWSWSAVPDSGGEKWSGAQDGSVFVSQTTSDSQVYVVDGEVKNGEGVHFWRTNLWNLRSTNYWYDYQDNMFMSVSDLPDEPGIIEADTSIARPVTTHDYHFKWGIIPYAIETYDGVALQDNEGNVEYLSSEEVQEHPDLHDDNVYPYHLTRTEIAALNWQDGVLNKVWYKDDLFKFAESQSAGPNEAPYTMQGADGQKQYYMLTSPQGSGDGLKDVFIQDGQTGEIQRFTAPSGMIGPQNAHGYVQGQSTPAGVTNWNEYEVVEVMPVTHNGELYYQGRIVKNDGPGMPGYAFVNAADSDDIVFITGDNKDVFASQFIDGQSLDDSMTTERETGTDADGNTVTYVVIYDENGDELGRYQASDISIEFETERTDSNSDNDE